MRVLYALGFTLGLIQMTSTWAQETVPPSRLFGEQPTPFQSTFSGTYKLDDRVGKEWIHQFVLNDGMAFGAAGEWFFGLEFPVSYFDGVGSNSFGVGDLQAQIARSFGMDTYSQALGVGGQFNTASRDIFGEGSTILSPYYALMIGLSPDLDLYTTVTYFDSVQESAGRTNTQRLEMDPLLLYRLSEDWYVLAGANSILDFSRSNDYQLILKGLLGVRVGEEQNVIFFTGVNAGMDTYTKNNRYQFQWMAGLRYIAPD